MRTFISVGILSLLLFACDESKMRNPDGTPVTPEDQDYDDEDELDQPANQAVDNTGRNELDRNTANPTPMDQGESAADIDITAQIRRAILDDEAMSVNADNAKIITLNGVVTLRGVVDSADERMRIETMARGVPGVVRVDNQLEVRPAEETIKPEDDKNTPTEYQPGEKIDRYEPPQPAPR